MKVKDKVCISLSDKFLLCVMMLFFVAIPSIMVNSFITYLSLRNEKVQVEPFLETMDSLIEKRLNERDIAKPVFPSDSSK